MKKILCLILHISSLFAAQKNNGPLLVQPARAASPTALANPQSASPTHITPLASPTNANKYLNDTNATSPRPFSRVFSQDLDDTEPQQKDDQMEQEKKNACGQPAHFSATSPQKPPNPPDINTMRTQPTRASTSSRSPYERTPVNCGQRCKFHCFNTCCYQECPTPCINFCNPFSEQRSPTKKCPPCCLRRKNAYTIKIAPTPTDKAKAAAAQASAK